MTGNLGQDIRVKLMLRNVTMGSCFIMQNFVLIITQVISPKIRLSFIRDRGKANSNAHKILNFELISSFAYEMIFSGGF